MKVVINIDEETYKAILHCAKNTPGYLTYCERMIADGKPLPKGHGDLKDMGNLKYVFDLTRSDHIYSGKEIERAIKSMKPIIEADKTESEG